MLHLQVGANKPKKPKEIYLVVNQPNLGKDNNVTKVVNVTANASPSENDCGNASALHGTGKHSWWKNMPKVYVSSSRRRRHASHNSSESFSSSEEEPEYGEDMWVMVKKRVARVRCVNGTTGK